jgi:PAS domain S-box-containing protein
MSKNEDNVNTKLNEVAGSATDLRSLLEALGENFWDWNLTNDEVFFSPSYQKMLGFTPGELGHRIDEWTKRLHPDDAKQAMQAMRSCLDGSVTTFQDEHRLLCHDGSWKWLRSRGTVVGRNSDHRPTRMICLITDVNDQHKELLREGSERYQQLANELDILISNAPLGVMFVSDGVIIRANKALASLCGFNNVKDMIGIKSTFLYRDDADYKSFSAKVIPKLVSDELVDLEWRVNRIDGSSFLARIVGKAITSEQYVRGAVWMLEDITEQHATLDALKYSEQRLQRLTHSNLIGIAQGSGIGRLSEANQLFLQICGYSMAELLQEETIWRFLLEGEHFTTCELAWVELLDTGSTAPFEVMLNHASGKKIPVLIGLSYLENSNSEWAVFMLDVSERHRINQLKSEFISVVSHELRTPLTSIRGSLGLLEAGIGGVLPEKAQHLIKIAHDNSRRLVGLVNDILDLEKLASGNMAFKSERLDLVALVEDAIEANTAYAVAMNVRLQLFNHPDQAWVMADADRLMQVLANFLSNASKFSPKGDVVRLQILAGTEYGKNVYQVEITDVGPGIPLAFQPRIFEPFSQADGTNTRQQGGTGLGLSITKSYVEKMHGKIGFVSVPDKGTTFWFSLLAVE